MIQIQLQQQDPSAAHNARAEQHDELKPFGDDGLTFGDVIDVFNPLQHIPVVGHIYRKFTGDHIDPAIRVAGGALFGGPIGAALSAVSVAVDEALKAGTDTEAILDDGAQVAQHNAEHLPPVALPNSLSLVKVASSGTRDRTTPTQVEAIESKTPTRTGQGHRGGWMIAYAYGAQATASDTETKDETKRLIDIAV